ncbi:MAG: hypothetical protein K2Q26_08125 [Bdellovibrionales bacterium]|nr:hypothetical protein [Bdellovibrionales bacterium]
MDGTPSYYASSAIDAAGNIIVAWMQEDSVGDYQIFKSEYRNGTWIHPTSLSDNISPDGRAAWYPKVTMNNNGVAIIVWYQSDGTRSQIFKSEYRNGAWTHPANLNDNISPDGQSGYSCDVAMDDAGNSLIAWVQYVGSDSQIFKSEYRNNTWTHPTSLTDNISPDGSSVVYQPYVSLNKNGTKALIYWDQIGATYTRILKSEYSNNSWAHPSSVDGDAISPDGGDAYIDFSRGTVNNAGDAVLLWWQYDGSFDQIFLSHYK